ncbi:MAG: molybdopterin molybdotransferase MoeA [Dermabacter sp.]|nr:molybdopterin molybdotransferase MoeA [Dermabacter sp.]
MNESAPGRISVSEHRRAVRDLMAAVASSPHAPGTEHVELSEALGRTLADDLRAGVNVPPVHNSQMDGFAYAASSLATVSNGETARLELGALIAAGSAPTALAPGTSRPIMTGAPLPDGADAVIAVEDTDLGRFSPSAPLPGAVSFTVAPAHREAGRFVRAAGSDTRQGDTVARAGTELSPALLGHIASVGIHSVPVKERYRVIVVSTGSELADPARPGAGDASDAAIFDANGPALTAALTDLGLDVCAQLRVPDDPRALVDTLTLALRETSAHLIVSTGGVSAGAVEPVRQAADLPGAPLRLAFQSVAMQPGGPQGLGVFDGPAGEVGWIALPGNPVSALVSIEMFVRDALGAPARPRLALPIRTQTGEPEPSPVGLLQVRRARLTSASTARLVGGPSSHLLGALALSDALVLVPEHTDTLTDGDKHDVVILR